MMPGDESASTEAGNLNWRRDWFLLAVLAPLAGLLTGVVGATFRMMLDEAERFRNTLIAWAHGEWLIGFAILVALCALSAGLAGWLVRRFSQEASGSGIPHVEAVLRGDVPQAPFRLIPVKFFGGLLAIGSGLALGREGPSVQMGATLSHWVGRRFQRDWDDCRVLLAAGAGAGLATAFNAPIAGAIFVLEELVRRFETRIAVAALGASATAIAVSRALIGGMPDFPVPPLASSASAAIPLYFVLGALAGAVAIAYNRSILGALELADRLSSLRVEARAALVGAAVGAAAWFAPSWVGGGDNLTQDALLGQGSVALLPLIFLFRFALGAVSYAAGTPGGLFAPMLVLGAQLGLGFGLVCQAAFPGLGIEPAGFALVGMAAFFTGVVRAPLTGIALVLEMTANVTLLLPVLAACYLAMLVPGLLGDPPIYDSLGRRVARPRPP